MSSQSSEVYEIFKAMQEKQRRRFQTLLNNALAKDSSALELNRAYVSGGTLFYESLRIEDGYFFNTLVATDSIDKNIGIRAGIYKEGVSPIEYLASRNNLERVKTLLPHVTNSYDLLRAFEVAYKQGHIKVLFAVISYRPENVFPIEGASFVSDVYTVMRSVMRGESDTIDLSGMPIGDVGARLISHAILHRALPELRHLRLAGCGIGNAGFDNFSEAIKVSEIETLSVADNPLEAFSVSTLMQKISGHPTLRSFDVQSNKLAYHGVTHFVSSMRVTPSRLVELNFGETELANISLFELLNTLPQMPDLRYMNLQGNAAYSSVQAIFMLNALSGCADLAGRLHLDLPSGELDESVKEAVSVFATDHQVDIPGMAGVPPEEAKSLDIADAQAGGEYFLDQTSELYAKRSRVEVAKARVKRAAMHLMSVGSENTRVVFVKPTASNPIRYEGAGLNREIIYYFDDRHRSETVGLGESGLTRFAKEKALATLCIVSDGALGKVVYISCPKKQVYRVHMKLAHQVDRFMLDAPDADVQCTLGLRINKHSYIDAANLRIDEHSQVVANRLSIVVAGKSRLEGDFVIGDLDIDSHKTQFNGDIKVFSDLLITGRGFRNHRNLVCQRNAVFGVQQYFNSASVDVALRLFARCEQIADLGSIKVGGYAVILTRLGSFRGEYDFVSGVVDCSENLECTPDAVFAIESRLKCTSARAVVFSGSVYKSTGAERISRFERLKPHIQPYEHVDDGVEAVELYAQESLSIPGQVKSSENLFLLSPHISAGDGSVIESDGYFAVRGDNFDSKGNVVSRGDLDLILKGRLYVAKKWDAQNVKKFRAQSALIDGELYLRGMSENARIIFQELTVIDKFIVQGNETAEMIVAKIKQVGDFFLTSLLCTVGELKAQEEAVLQLLESAKIISKVLTGTPQTQLIMKGDSSIDAIQMEFNGAIDLFNSLVLGREQFKHVSSKLVKLKDSEIQGEQVEIDSPIEATHSVLRAVEQLMIKIRGRAVLTDIFVHANHVFCEGNALVKAIRMLSREFTLSGLWNVSENIHFQIEDQITLAENSQLFLNGQGALVTNILEQAGKVILGQEVDAKIEQYRMREPSENLLQSRNMLVAHMLVWATSEQGLQLQSAICRLAEIVLHENAKARVNLSQIFVDDVNVAGSLAVSESSVEVSQRVAVTPTGIANVDRTQVRIPELDVQGDVTVTGAFGRIAMINLNGDAAKATFRNVIDQDGARDGALQLHTINQQAGELTFDGCRLARLIEHHTLAQAAKLSILNRSIYHINQFIWAGEVVLRLNSLLQIVAPQLDAAMRGNVAGGSTVEMPGVAQSGQLELLNSTLNIRGDYSLTAQANLRLLQGSHATMVNSSIEGSFEVQESKAEAEADINLRGTSQTTLARGRLEGQNVQMLGHVEVREEQNLAEAKETLTMGPGCHIEGPGHLKVKGNHKAIDNPNVESAGFGMEFEHMTNDDMNDCLAMQGAYARVNPSEYFGTKAPIDVRLRRRVNRRSTVSLEAQQVDIEESMRSARSLHIKATQGGVKIHRNPNGRNVLHADEDLSITAENGDFENDHGGVEAEQGTVKVSAQTITTKGRGAQHAEGAIKGKKTFLHATTGEMLDEGALISGTQYLQAIAEGNIVVRCFEEAKQTDTGQQRFYHAAKLQGGTGLDDDNNVIHQGYGLMAETHGHGIVDASKIEGDGSIFLRMQSGADFRARGSRYVHEIETYEGWFGRKKYRKHTKTRVGGGTLKSRRGKVSVETEGELKMKAQSVKGSRGIELKADNMEFSDYVADERVETEDTYLWGVLGSVTDKKEQQSIQTKLVDQAYTRLEANRAINAIGSSFMGGDLTVIAQSAKFEDRILQNSYYERKREIGFTLGRQPLKKIPMADRAKILAMSGPVLRSLHAAATADTWSEALTSGAMAVYQGAKFRDRMQEVFKKLALENPDLKNIDKLKAIVKEWLKGTGCVDWKKFLLKGGVDWTQTETNIKEQTVAGADMRRAGNIRSQIAETLRLGNGIKAKGRSATIDAKRLEVEAAQLERTQKTTQDRFSVGASLASGKPTDFSYAHMQQSQKNKTHIQAVLEMEETLDVQLEETDLTGGALKSGAETTGDFGRAAATTTVDKQESSTFSFAFSSDFTDNHLPKEEADMEGKSKSGGKPFSDEVMHRPVSVVFGVGYKSKQKTTDIAGIEAGSIDAQAESLHLKGASIHGKNGVVLDVANELEGEAVDEHDVGLDFSMGVSTTADRLTSGKYSAPRKPPEPLVLDLTSPGDRPPGGEPSGETLAGLQFSTEMPTEDKPAADFGPKKPTSSMVGMGRTGFKYHQSKVHSSITSGQGGAVQIQNAHAAGIDLNERSRREQSGMNKYLHQGVIFPVFTRDPDEDTPVDPGADDTTPPAYNPLTTFPNG